MKTIIKNIIIKINEMTSNEQFQKNHKTSENDFIRKRKLSFQSVIFFVLGLVSTTLDFEVLNFCKKADISSISAAALSKARDKINYRAFRDLLKETQKLIPQKNKFKGYKVIAVDGIKGELPNTPELMSKYKPSKNTNYPQFHAVAAFDVLNCCFIDADFLPSPTNERKIAYELLAVNTSTDKEIYLYDRGFPSVSLIQQLNKLEKKFVMRVSSSFLKEVNEFSRLNSKDKLVHIDFDAKRARASEVKNVDFPYSFELRCVKIELRSKKTEILITNLPKSEFSRKDIGNLYGSRWGIETNFNHLKNAIFVEDFVGIKENSIKQEFYATLIKYNLFLLFVGEAELINNYKKNFKI